MKRSTYTLLLLLLFISCGEKETPTMESPTEMSYEDYTPKSTLVVAEHPKMKAKYPFIDVHNHQFAMPFQILDNTVADMDELNMKVMVNLSGWKGSVLKWGRDNIEKYHPTRFITFANVNFMGIDDPDWTEEAVAQLQADYDNGARGLKIYKNLGMTATNSRDERIATDDPRIDPIWAKCGELGIPVLIHTAEPGPFWTPKDSTNERWLELKLKPGRQKIEGKDPSWESLLAEQHNVFRKHKNTKFINAHFGWFGNDLDRLGKLFDEMPNVYTEMGAVVAELGRQPRSARAFLIKYQDRVMFGKDSWNPKEYYVYFRILETNDEYFDYYRRYHAHWKMYGLNLPDEVLKKIYYKNALEVVPGIDKSFFPE